mgnify:CR=1 FL=1
MAAPLQNDALRRDIAIALVLVAIFASIPLWGGRGFIFLSAVVMINMIFALGFNLIFGLAGFVSFGHAAFFAVGAYTTGLLLQDPEATFAGAWLAAGGVGGMAAAAIAIVGMRRTSGIYFAVLTLAFAELIRILISKSTLLGREDGMTGIKRPVIGSGLFDIDLSSGNNLYYVTLVLVVLMGGILYVLWHNRFGRLLAATRQEPDRVTMLGGNIHALRLGAFITSGVFSGLAGGLYAPMAQLLTPDLAQWTHSALPILFALVGGVSYFWGPVAGAVVFMGLEHATRNIVGLSELIVGAVLLLVVLIVPGGLIGGLERLRQRISKTRHVEGAVLRDDEGGAS